MRMIEADDVQSARTRFAARLDVIRGIDQETRGMLREIGRADSADNGRRRSDQHATALGRSGFARVSDDGVANGARNDHSVSMIIALPMPPPMHNAATP